MTDILPFPDLWKPIYSGVPPHRGTRRMGKRKNTVACKAKVIAKRRSNNKRARISRRKNRI